MQTDQPNNQYVFQRLFGNLVLLRIQKPTLGPKAPLKRFEKAQIGPFAASWLPYSTYLHFFFLCWVGGGNPLYAAVKSLSPHCDQEGQGRDNFFSKCIFYARSYGGNVKNRSKKCEEPSVIGPESSIPDLKSLGSSNCWIWRAATK